MIFKKVIIAAVIFFSASLTHASELSNQLEEKILNEDWKGFSQITSRLYNASPQDLKTVDAAESIKRFMRNCNTLTGLPDNQATSFRKTIVNGYNQIPKNLPFSQILIDKIYVKKNEAMERFSKLDEDNHKRKEEANAKREQERLKKDEERRAQDERRRIILAQLEEKRKHREEEIKIETLKQEERRDKIQKEQEENEKYQAALDKAESSPEYQKVQTVCNVCSAMQERTAVEKALDVDAKYARKYGVVNLTRRDNGVQMIKANDRIIMEGRADYKDLFGKVFSPLVCKKVKVDDCEGDLEVLSKSLAEKYLAGQP